MKTWQLSILYGLLMSILIGGFAVSLGLIVAKAEKEYNDCHEEIMQDCMNDGKKQYECMPLARNACFF
jgi:hypothetical protein